MRMRDRWVSATGADSRPTDFDPRFYRPQPNQSKDRGADQNVQDGEKIRVPSWWLNNEFQGMKTEAGSRDDLWAARGIQRHQRDWRVTYQGYELDQGLRTLKRRIPQGGIPQNCQCDILNPETISL